MKDIVININVKQCGIDELDDNEKLLITKAIDATKMSYAPYSQFNVGAALLLDNNDIIIGANQENASFPAGLCAERAALYNAQSNQPDKPIKAIAIAARTKEGLTPEPITPCGVCRQSILEAEQRYKNSIRLYLYGTNYINIINSIKDLLPLSFTDDSMK